MEKKIRIGVLVSGQGTNLQAILESIAQGCILGEVVLVISNVADAPALGRAKRFGIDTSVVNLPERSVFETELIRQFNEKGVDLIVLAGFMRLLTPLFVHAFWGRIVNIHPSLLPAFPGLHPQRQALAYGVRYTGCTVHFVDEGCDTGPIILQAPVLITEKDDEETLSQKIRIEEHRIYPEAIRLFAEGRLKIEGRCVRILPHPNVSIRN